MKITAYYGSYERVLDPLSLWVDRLKASRPRA